MHKYLLQGTAFAAVLAGAAMLATSFLGHAFTREAPLSPALVAKAGELNTTRINMEAYDARPQSHADVNDRAIHLPLARAPFFTGAASDALSAVSMHNGGTAVMRLCIHQAYADASWSCSEARSFIVAPAEFVVNLDRAAGQGPAELNKFLLSAAVDERRPVAGAAVEYNTVRVVFTTPWGITTDGVLFWVGALVFLSGMAGILAWACHDNTATTRRERCPTCGGPAPRDVLSTNAG